MCLPEGKKNPLTHLVGTGNTIEIDLDFPGRTALGDGVRQTFCPFPHKFPVQYNSDSILQIQDRGS
jgi:hypothetical protein